MTDYSKDEPLAGILATLRGNRERYVSFCRSLSAEELERPVPQSIWTVQGYAAHLGTIDRTVQTWFQALVSASTPGSAPAPTPAASAGPPREPFDVDRWNESQVARRTDWDLERILDEMAHNRERLERVLVQFTPEILDGNLAFPGDRDRPPADVNVLSYLRAWVMHDPAHAMDMLRALPERASDPELVAWLRP